MRANLLLTSLVVAVLGLAACGSSKSSSSTSTTTTTVTKPSTAPAKKGKAAAAGKKKATAVPRRTYSLKMTGKAETPPGAPKGSARAVISLHGSTNQVCWRFSHLHGFASPTFAHIHKAPAGKSGNIVVPLSTGPKFLAKGCVDSTPTLIKAMEKDPHGYYVNIHSKKYPGGAVRAQL
jgi:hypothetical protein